MHKLDSHHFMPAYLCVHRPQSRTAIRHSFCSTHLDSLMDSQIEFGRSCRSGRAADTGWYREMADMLAHDMEACDEQAAAIINGESPAVYATNMNYGTFDVESVAKLDTSYTLVDADTVSYMVRQQPDLLPQVSVKPGRAETWARRKITSAMTQSILQGESVPDAARRIRSVVEMDRRASLRAARTALTGAENAGRMGSYRRASDMGIELQKQWMAALDSHTRDSHRELDGEKADIDGRFSNGLRYPGDPTGPASEVWNCRCTMVAALPGHDVLRDRNTSKLETSYEEWKAGRDPKRQEPADRTMASFFQMPGTIAKLNSSGVSMTEARRSLTEQLREYGISSGSFRKLSAGDQQKALDAALSRGTAGSGVHSAGSGARSAWLSQFPNETMQIKSTDGRVLNLIGDAGSVEVPEDKFELLRGASVRHTHTTTIAGTFGVDDVALTVDGHVAHHEVYAAKTDTTYVLDRLASCTDESAERFKQAFASYDSETFEDLRYEYWKQHYEAAGIPMDDRDDIEVDKLLKPKLHKWLEDNAASYGFRYSSSDGV